jgi:hypothetical protein
MIRPFPTLRVIAAGLIIEPAIALAVSFQDFHVLLADAQQLGPKYALA